MPSEILVPWWGPSACVGFGFLIGVVVTTTIVWLTQRGGRKR